MLFSADAGFVDTSGFASYRVGDCTYYLKGIFFMRGRKAGRESIEAFAQEAERTGALPYAKAFGAFSCAFVRPTGETIFFTDNSNLNCFYLGSGSIGDRFLDVVRHEHASAFDDDAVCELLGLGGVFFGKTLVAGILLSASESTYICFAGVIRQEDKDIGDIDEPSSIQSVPAFFRDIAYALSDERVTLSLTGGYDSRLVFACLRDHLRLDVFMSCTNPSSSDLHWAKRVAQAGGTTLEVVNVAKPSVGESFVRELFECADGDVPFLDDSYIRVSAFMHTRLDAGYTCYLTGDGGVRHKDWYWLQDFPYYRMRRTNLSRFYDQRIQIVRNSVPIGGRLEEPYRRMRHRIVREMRRYLRPINTESYDCVGYHVQGDLVKPKYTALSRIVTSYAPLWELELVRYSYHLPRRERFFYNSMRRIITGQSKTVARTPTVYGTTASSEVRYLMRDVLFQGIDYLRKALRLLGRTLLGRNLLVSTEAWSAEGDIRDLELTRRALGYGKKQGFIAGDTSLNDVPYAVLGRIIQLYLLGERLGLGARGGHRHDAAAGDRLVGDVAVLASNPLSGELYSVGLEQRDRTAPGWAG